MNNPTKGAASPEVKYPNCAFCGDQLNPKHVVTHLPDGTAAHPRCLRSFGLEKELAYFRAALKPASVALTESQQSAIRAGERVQLVAGSHLVEVRADVDGLRRVLFDGSDFTSRLTVDGALRCVTHLVAACLEGWTGP